MTEAGPESLRRRIEALETELAALRAEAGEDAPSTPQSRFDPLRTIQRYRALFNAIDIGFAVIEVIYDGDKAVDCRFLEANQAFQEMTGVLDPIGRTANEMMPQENIYWMRLYGRVSETGVPMHQETLSDSKDRWLDVQAFQLGEAADRQVAIFVSDITARRNSDIALRASEDRLQQALSAGQGVGTWDWDVESDLVVADERFAKLYGVDPEVAARGTTIEHFFANIHPDDLPEAKSVVIGALHKGGPFSAEYRLLQADGSIRWVIAKGSCELSAAGKAVRFPGVTFDITDRKEAEQALRESEEQFRVFAQAVPNQIWAARPDGHLYWFNQQVYAYSGESLATLEGIIDWTRIVHPDDVADAGQIWINSLTTGQVYETEFRIRRADGIYRWFLVRAEPVFGTDGKIARWVGTNTDIDDRRRQSAELERLNETLEEKVEARTRDLMQVEEALRQSQKMEAVGQLTGGLAHDFNNLLTGISGSLELLGIRIAQGRLADVERYAAAAQSAAKRAASLTHRLLAFSRRQTLDPRPTDVNRLVADIEDMIRRTVGPEIEVEVVAAGGLWPTMVDPNQLENAILNLCINARDAMPDGGRLTIETANRWLDTRAARDRDLEAGQYVSLCVSDNGTGMAPDVIAKAFDPFFTTKPLGLGTGLGLSMTYGFARQSGGQARIYSEVGEGAMICLYLPRHFGTADAAEVPPETIPAPRAEVGETVLVVDDEPTIRMLVAEILEELGYAAIEAADGAGGLAILQSDARIDLLITDVGLPGGMNGRQMADAARVGRPDLKILFITGYAENAVVGNGHLEPGMHVMTKPFGMEALGKRIKGLISSD